MRLLFLFFVIGLLLTGCGKEAQVEEEAPLVRTLAVTERDVLSAKEYTGRVVARHEVNLAFQVGGEINGRFADPGKFVSAGEVLMTVNPRDVSASERTAAAEVEARRVEAELAQVNAARYRELYADGAAPKAVLDEYETRAEAALSALDAAKGSLTRARNAAGYANLTAPADGVVSAVLADAGQVVAAGSPVLTLAGTKELEIEIDLPEREFASIKPGDAAVCGFFGTEGEFAAFVREITPAADAASRTFKVRLTLEAFPEGVALGKSAKVKFTAAQKAVEIPLSAIDRGDGGDGGTCCWFVEDGRVYKRPVHVEPGEHNTAKASVPAGAVIVTAGIHLLKEGMEVRRDDGR